MKARIFIEGGGDSKDLRARCRMGFRRLLERCGLEGKMPRLVACGAREEAFDGFTTAHRHAGPDDYVAMLVDSEDPVKDKERPWAHLKRCDGWDRPEGADDKQVLLMTTCMETWIVCDRKALSDHFGECLRGKALPASHNLESRHRNAIQTALVEATRDCGKRRYAKGKISFEIVGKLDPAPLRRHLPHFKRSEEILKKNL